MNASTRTALLVVLALVVLGSLGTLAIGAFVWMGLGSFGGDLEWSRDEVPERSLADAFGVRLPSRPVRYQSRVMGFQDLHFEVLVQLRPDGVEEFLERNGLGRGAPATLEPDVEEVIDRLDPLAPRLKASTLALPPALLPDGGARNLHRSGQLLEGPGAAWVYLLAFET